MYIYSVVSVTFNRVQSVHLLDILISLLIRIHHSHYAYVALRVHTCFSHIYITNTIHECYFARAYLRLVVSNHFNHF